MVEHLQYCGYLIVPDADAHHAMVNSSQVHLTRVLLPVMKEPLLLGMQQIIPTTVVATPFTLKQCIRTYIHSTMYNIIIL